MLANRVRIGSVKKKIYMAQDSDFISRGGGLRWIGSEKEIEIPPIIHGDVVTNYNFMFNMKDTWLGVVGGVTKIVNKNHNITSLYNMFVGYDTPYLDLSKFNLSDGVNVEYMFAFCKAKTLDLSGFDTSKILSANNMFYNCLATTGYARTQADADKFNASEGKPAGLNFVVKPYLAQDSDFVKVYGYWVYKGTELEIKIPHVIQGESVTSYENMFSGSSTYKATPVTRVVSDNPNVTDMSYMFGESKAKTLDLSNFDTSNVTDMGTMFINSAATTLDLSGFDTSKVTKDNMKYMFSNSPAKVGYARTQADANKFNASAGKPAGLNFVVK